MPERHARIVLAGETPETVVVTGAISAEAEDARQAAVGLVGGTGL
jgi:hypothetical protein